MRIITIVALVAAAMAVQPQGQTPGADPAHGQVQGGRTPAAAGPLQADLKAGLVRQLDHLAGSIDGVVGYVVSDLTTNERVAARLEGDAFPTASAIKLSVLYELLKQSESGTLDLDTPRPVDRSTLVGGSGVLRYLGTPSLSLRDHATLMIMVSDNSSTNIVIDAVGMAKVNARMAALGLGDIRLRRLMMDAAAVARGDENVAGPQSLARSAELLWTGEGLSAASRGTALGMLKLVGGAIRRGVPAAVPVYAKTGGLDGVVTEAGVIDVPGRPFSMAVMTTYVADTDESSRAIREMATAAWRYFDRIARGGAYGRK
jgi:beta-lactamase class A